MCMGLYCWRWTRNGTPTPDFFAPGGGDQEFLQPSVQRSRRSSAPAGGDLIRRGIEHARLRTSVTGFLSTGGRERGRT